MGIRYRILEDHTLAFVAADGEPVDLAERLEDLLREDDFLADYCILIDVRRRSSAPTTQVVRDFVRWLGENGDRMGRVAMLVESPGQYGMGRMTELQADVEWFRVFASVEEAEAWLLGNRGDVGRLPEALAALRE